jgi:hypothetical protein
VGLIMLVGGFMLKTFSKWLFLKTHKEEIKTLVKFKSKVNRSNVFNSSLNNVIINRTIDFSPITLDLPFKEK